MDSPRAYLPEVINSPRLLEAAGDPWWLGDVKSVHDRATGKGQVVGVLGTGLDVTWAKNLLARGQLQFYKPDDNGHETGCVSCVFSIAPEAEFRVYKCLDVNGTGSMADCTAAVRKATAEGCTVINGSFGANSEYQPLTDALEEADRAGILNCFAAGNAGSRSLSFPAAGKFSWSVGAHDKGNIRASFSGGRPDNCAGGVNVKMWAREGQWTVASGTSFACPHTAGAMALWLDAMGRTNQADKSGSVWADDMRATCLDMDESGFDSLSGSGAIQFKALIDRVYARKAPPIQPPPANGTIYLPELRPGERWAIRRETVPV